MRGMVTTLCLLLTGTSGVATPVAQLKASADGKIASVEGKVSGRILHFDVDSGALNSIIDLRVAKSLGISLLGYGMIRGAGTGSVPIRHLGRIMISLGAASFEPSEPIAVDLSNVGQTTPLDGLLGFDFFRRYVVDLDYDRSIITLYDPDSYVYRGSGATIPLLIRPPRIFVRVIVAARGVPSQQHLLRLDTGSDDDVDDDIVMRSSAPKKPILGGVGIGSRFRSYLGVVTELRLGPLTLHNLSSATGGVQLIGNGVLRRFRVVIDTQRSVMYLTPRKTVRT